jgi:hypothetical protein
MTQHFVERVVLQGWIAVFLVGTCLAGHRSPVTGHWSLGHPLAYADVPRTIHYQGKLVEPDGSPLVGEHTVTLRLYGAAAEGTELWEESHTLNLSQLDSGVFSVVLGSHIPFGSEITFNDPLWLTTEVDGQGEFSPRQPLSAVSYAINADLIDGLDSADLSFLGPSIDPSELAEGSVGAAALAANAIQTGDIEVGDLPLHASTHQPGGSDALPTASATSVGAANGAGTSTSLARADHTHQGLHSVNVAGAPQIVGDATLAAGSNVTLTQDAQSITIAAAGGGAAGNRVTNVATEAVPIGTAADTDLLSATITKSQASSALLILATVQLIHTGKSDDKTIQVKLFRGATQLDANYIARIGKEDRAVSELPVTLHFWDTSGAGTHTVTLRARSSGAGAQATVRRLTVIEL